jgi:hypothetical protein
MKPATRLHLITLEKSTLQRKMTMANVKAYAIHAIGARAAGAKVLIPASTKEKPSVFVTTEEKFAELEKAGAARKPTDAELAIAEHRGDVTDTTVAEPKKKSSVGDDRPATGAVGDPQGSGKKGGKAKAAGKPADDEGKPADDDDAGASGAEGDDI